MSSGSGRLIVMAAVTLAVLVMAGCAQNRFETQPDGMVVRLAKAGPTDPGLVKIQVCADNVLRVVAAPASGFSSRPSLMVANSEWKPVPYSVRRKGDTLQIATSRVVAKVAIKTGEVAFYDKAGRLILQERPGGGKTIADANVMGERTYHVRQVWLSPADEAFYGLGQHRTPS